MKQGNIFTYLMLSAIPILVGLLIWTMIDQSSTDESKKFRIEYPGGRYARTDYTDSIIEDEIGRIAYIDQHGKPVVLSGSYRITKQNQSK
jgi:hypothetical protein